MVLALIFAHALRTFRLLFSAPSDDVVRYAGVGGGVGAFHAATGGRGGLPIARRGFCTSSRYVNLCMMDRARAVGVERAWWCLN